MSFIISLENGRLVSIRGDKLFRAFEGLAPGTPENLVLTEDERKVVQSGKTICPQCLGFYIGGYYTTGKRIGGILERDMSQGECRLLCPCFHYRWANDIWQEKVGIDKVTLASLEYSPLVKVNLDFQKAVIALVQNHPYGSFCFFGPTGMGKTYIADALYWHALAQVVKQAPLSINSPSRCRLPLWRISTRLLLDEEHSYRMDKDKGTGDKRTVSPDMILDVDWNYPHLFLSEMDKIHPVTTPKQDTVHEYINALYGRLDRGGPAQIVIDTNMSLSQFEREDSFGPAMARRLAEYAFRIDYSATKILRPTKPVPTEVS